MRIIMSLMEHKETYLHIWCVWIILQHQCSAKELINNCWNHHIFQEAEDRALLQSLNSSILSDQCTQEEFSWAGWDVQVWNLWHNHSAQLPLSKLLLFLCSSPSLIWPSLHKHPANGHTPEDGWGCQFIMSLAAGKQIFSNCVGHGWFSCTVNWTWVVFSFYSSSSAS